MLARSTVAILINWDARSHWLRRLHHQMMQTRRWLLNWQLSEFLELTVEEENSFAISDMKQNSWRQRLRMPDLQSYSGARRLIDSAFRAIFKEFDSVPNRRGWWSEIWVCVWDSVNWGRSVLVLWTLGSGLIQHWWTLNHPNQNVCQIWNHRQVWKSSDMLRSEGIGVLLTRTQRTQQW